MRRLLLIAFLVTTPALGRAAEFPATIAVEGEASVKVLPDAAVIAIGVVTERLKAAEAAAENDKTVAALFDALKSDGIDAHDVETTAVGVTALYDNSARATPRITGFQATNRLRIRVSPIEKAGAVAGLLIDKGANSIESIVFIVNPDAKRDDQLRADAMRDAKRKAEVYVEAIGLKLGRLITISPMDGLFPRGSAPLSKMVGNVPLAAGTEDQHANVSVRFEILQ